MIWHNFIELLKDERNLVTQSFGLFVPYDLKPYMLETIDPFILFGEPSHLLFDFYSNEALHQKLLEAYIIAL